MDKAIHPRIGIKEKAEKEKIKYLSPLQKITIFSPIIDNTTKFCAKLLEVDTNSRSLKLKDQEFHTEKYYHTLLNLKNYSETPQKGKEEAKALKKELEKI
ncbi:MAG: hypothetical protein ACR5KV_03815 [Wolbachia sp.]